MAAEVGPGSVGNLNRMLLMGIMQRLHELQANIGSLVRTDDLTELIPVEVSFPSGSREGVLRNFYLDRHLEYLKERGYVTLGTLTLAGVRVVQLTALGWEFVQPELAEFGRSPLLPDVLKALEDKIQILSYPQEEKAGLLYRLRDAIAQQAPDVIAKVIVEISAKLMRGA